MRTGAGRSTVLVYGLRIGLDADSGKGLADLRSVVPPGARQSRRSARDIAYAIRRASRSSVSASGQTASYVDGRMLDRSADYQAVVQGIHRHVQLFVAEHAPRRVFIHAGVVAWKGQAVVMPGRTHFGKSTLVAAFLRAGATYYSDEFAVVDSLGRIHPYPQLIALRDGNGRSRRVDPSELSASVGRKPIMARLILVTRHRPGAQWGPQRISRGEGMLALLTNTVAARSDPARALGTLTRLLAGATILKGSRGEADALVDHLVTSGQLPAWRP
jgi:hypothetical protein